jgi:hypothetical protein
VEAVSDDDDDELEDDWDADDQEDWDEYCDVCCHREDLSDVCPECGFGVCQSCRVQLKGPCDCGEFTWK